MDVDVVVVWEVWVDTLCPVEGGSKGCMRDCCCCCCGCGGTDVNVDDDVGGPEGVDVVAVPSVPPPPPPPDSPPPSPKKIWPPSPLRTFGEGERTGKPPGTAVTIMVGVCTGDAVWLREGTAAVAVAAPPASCRVGCAVCVSCPPPPTFAATGVPAFAGPLPDTEDPMDRTLVGGVPNANGDDAATAADDNDDACDGAMLETT